jgi:PAS domain S-box-containing protein
MKHGSNGTQATPSSSDHDSTITTDHRSWEFLQTSRIYAQSIFETVRESLVVLDAELRVKLVNHSFYQTFQVSPAETYDRVFFELGDGQWQIPALHTLLMTVLLDNTPFENFEVEHEFQHIGHKVMLINARQIFQDNNQSGLILLAIEDITERKQTEETLKRFTARLEQSNRELQDFASVASHDLQEPLRKIQAFGDLLTSECGHSLPETGQQYLQRMQNAAARMQLLINDLLAFSRVTTKAQPFVRVDLATIAQEVLSDLEVQIQRVGGRVDVGFLPTINADPLQMRQLLQNLLGNSLKFHQPGVQPLITLQAQILNQQDASNVKAVASEVCQIKVSDNGIGFEEKYLDRIFTVFQRLHYRNEYEGTGVGLAICRKIAERHSGSITATSKLGTGATFIVTLPLKQLPILVQP